MVVTPNTSDLLNVSADSSLVNKRVSWFKIACKVGNQALVRQTRLGSLLLYFHEKTPLSVARTRVVGKVLVWYKLWSRLVLRVKSRQFTITCAPTQTIPTRALARRLTKKTRPITGRCITRVIACVRNSSKRVITQSAAADNRFLIELLDNYFFNFFNKKIEK